MIGIVLPGVDKNKKLHAATLLAHGKAEVSARLYLDYLSDGESRYSTPFFFALMNHCRSCDLNFMRGSTRMGPRDGT